MSEKVFTVVEVAEKMKVNRRTVQSWIDNGDLKAVDVRPSKALRAMWRIQADDLKAFSRKRKKNEK